MTYKEALFSDDTVSSIDHAFETGAAGKPHVEQSQKICLEIKKNGSSYADGVPRSI